jgi:hypothetical protein
MSALTTSDASFRDSDFGPQPPLRTGIITYRRTGGEPSATESDDPDQTSPSGHGQ